MRWLAGLALCAAVVGALPPAVAAQDAPPTTVGAADKATLEARVREVEARLAELDGRIAQQRAGVEQAAGAVAAFGDQVLANEQETVDTRARRDAPLRLRTELAVELFIGGDPSRRTFTDFVRNGELGTEAVRRQSVFDVVHEDATARLAALDARLVELEQIHAALVAQRDAAEAVKVATQAQLDASIAERSAAARDLDVARDELRRALAIAKRGPLNGAVDYPIRPALGVKIDNSIDARPQTGLMKADVMYEIIVEGGITRFLAVFQSTDAERLGPVRSARTSDISLMAAYNNPLYAYSGGNDGVLDAIAVAPMNSLTESSNPEAFFRDESRFAPHNLYTRTAALYAAQADSGVPIPQFTFRQPGERAAPVRPISGVEFQIGDDTVSYTWNGSGWERLTNGRPHVDTTSGQVAPENVIVQFTNYGPSPADARSPDALTVGQGRAWVLTDGQLIEARWARSVATAPIQYLDAANQQIPLTPGRTWVAMPEPGTGVVF